MHGNSSDYSTAASADVKPIATCKIDINRPGTLGASDIRAEVYGSKKGSKVRVDTIRAYLTHKTTNYFHGLKVEVISNHKLKASKSWSYKDDTKFDYIADDFSRKWQDRSYYSHLTVRFTGSASSSMYAFYWHSCDALISK